MDFVIGIDVGGTKILVGSCDMNFNLLVSRKVPTNAHSDTKEQITQRMIACIRDVIDETEKTHSGYSLRAIGIGAPGPVDSAKGVVIDAGNLGNWHHVPIVSILSGGFGVPSFLEKDGNIAALGEFTLGAGRGTRNLAVVTVGTGLGCGLILNGQIYSGRFGFAGEFGHIVISEQKIPCVCGGYGCLEMFTCGKAMVRMMKEAIAAGKSSCLSGDFTAVDIQRAAESGDGLALAVIREVGDYLGRGLVSLINLLGPDKVLIGGGVSNLGNVLLDTTKSVVRDRAYTFYRDTPIERTTLGTNSGLFGAAVLAKRSLESAEVCNG